MLVRFMYGIAKARQHVIVKSFLFLIFQNRGHTKNIFEIELSNSEVDIESMIKSMD